MGRQKGLLASVRAGRIMRTRMERSGWCGAYAGPPTGVRPERCGSCVRSTKGGTQREPEGAKLRERETGCDTEHPLIPPVTPFPLVHSAFIRNGSRAMHAKRLSRKNVGNHPVSMPRQGKPGEVGC